MNYNLRDPKGKRIERDVHVYNTKNSGTTYGVVRYNGKDRVLRYNEKTKETYVAEEAEY